METNQGSPKYWQSLEQWKNDPEFQKLADKEFLSSPHAEEGNSSEGGWARRDFLKLMSASIALSSFGCVRRTAQKIVPHVKQPPEVVNGFANYYSSSLNDGGEGLGIVVKTREGRPIYAKGNEFHPSNMGGMSARAHAAVLDLYDPDRLSGAVKNLLNKEKTNRDTVAVNFEAADKEIAEALNKGGVAILTGSLSSPSTKKLIGEFASAFGAETYSYEPISYEEIRLGQQASYGTAVIPRYRIDKARLLVSIDTDFLGTFLAPTEHNRLYSEARKPGKNMLRHVAFESMMSLTGTNADSRFRIRPSQHLDLVMAILENIIVKQNRSRYATDSSAKNVVSSFKSRIAALEVPADVITKISQELWDNRGQSLVLAGGPATMTAQGLDLQVAVNFLNSVLDNDGATIDFSNATNLCHQGTTGSLIDLAKDLESGKIKTLIIHGVNPLYAAPASLKLKDAIKKPEMVIYTGDRIDETGLFANFVMADQHSFEKWGDHEFFEGVFSIQQPTIEPMGATRAFEDSLLSWGKAAGKGFGKTADTWYEYVRQNWRANIFGRAGVSGSFESNWNELLQKGVAGSRKGDNVTGSGRGFQMGRFNSIKANASTSAGHELVLYPSVGLRDGTLANVPWLQEFPDPVSKICWENYVSVSPKTADDNNLRENTIIEVTVGDQKFERPVHIQPGQDDGTLAIALGYGRTAAGQVANGLGVDVYPFVQVANKMAVYSGLPATFKKTGGYDQLANCQGHHSMPQANYLTGDGVTSRQIVVEETIGQFNKKPGANIHRHKVFSMWSKHEYPGHKWGMVIDLNSCTGCGACVIACQSENNIPTVGKKYVVKGREMHWIRIDRYYKGTPEQPDTVHMPMLCQHCDNAPCETVCPVLATVHGPEGTNDMIYNRCVGTRYCSNNCPYKVRRFNWFNYIKNTRAPQNQAMNPDVTIRARGVMEKCTFCLHRIKTGKLIAKNEGRTLKDGDIVTACQESCPTGCISFGDLNDENSKVRSAFFNERNYELLEELNNATAVRYLSKVRNAEHIIATGKGHEGIQNETEGKHHGGGDHAAPAEGHEAPASEHKTEEHKEEAH